MFSRLDSTTIQRLQHNNQQIQNNAAAIRINRIANPLIHRSVHPEVAS